MLKLYCCKCEADKPRYLFTPTEQKAADRGRAAYCMMCQREYRRGRISSAIRPQKKCQGEAFRRNPILLPNSFQGKEERAD